MQRLLPIIFVLVVLAAMLLSGCAMFVPLSEFEDSKGIPRGTFRTSMSVENGYLYRIIRGKKEAESIGWFIASSAAFGLTNDIGIRYSTWYTSLPIISSRIGLPLTIVRSGDWSLGLNPSWTYASGGQFSINDNMSHQVMRIWSLSMPVGYGTERFTVYAAPRLWRSVYVEGWYEELHDANGERLPDIIREAEYRSSNLSLAVGVSLRYGRYSIMPECVLHSVEEQHFATFGVRFGLDH